MGTGIRIRFLSFVRVRDKGVSPSLSLSLSLSLMLTCMQATVGFVAFAYHIPSTTSLSLKKDDNTKKGN